MRALALLRIKRIYARGFVEIAVWRVPEPIPPCTHSFKYRLAYVVHGRRVIGYDNERGKGDHRHVEGKESPYTFRGVETLLSDFWKAIDTYGGEK